MATQLVNYIFLGSEATTFDGRKKQPWLSTRTAPRGPDCDAETIASHPQRGVDRKWGRRCAVPIGYYPVERLVNGVVQEWHVKSADGRLQLDQQPRLVSRAAEPLVPVDRLRVG